MISIVIPVYNGEATLMPLFFKTKETFINNELGSFEVIFVYDCGADNSWEIIKQIVTQNKKIAKGIKLSRNFGQHNALICGFTQAKGEFIVTMDEDLQHNPEDIPKLYHELLEKNLDVLYGKFKKQEHSFFRSITSSTLRKLLSFGIPGLHPDYSSYRMLRKNITKRIIKMDNSYTFLDGYIAWVTANVGSIELKHNKRLKDKSSYNLKKLIEHSINIFVTFSNYPIRFVTLSSVVIFTATLMFSARLIYQRLVGKIEVPGYASLAVGVGLGVGFILLGLGIIGEYIYRINLKTTKRPNFNIDHIIEE